MDYRQAIEYVLSFADFERSGRFQDRPDVAPMLSLLRRLGDPHLGRLTVHIAGSKGKGSVAAMVGSILRAAGFTSGLYTSPHLHSYCERIRVNGRPVSEGEFASLTAELQPAVEAERRANPERSLVTFDLLTALAFMAFRAHGLQAQVIEVGLGGRVDSTNVFDRKEVCVITPLSLEHTAILGDTVEKIAREKAAIIRPGATVVLAPQAHPEAAAVVQETAEREGALLKDVKKDYRWETLDHDLYGQNVRLIRSGGSVGARLPLLGAHQVENAATALAVADALRDQGIGIGDGNVVEGLANVRWPGRLEVLRERPLILADGAHNRDSARRLREALRDYFGITGAVFVVGSSSDKDIQGVAEELGPIAAAVVATRSDSPRAMEPRRIAETFGQAGVEAVTSDTLREAMRQALAVAGEQQVICVVGSLFVVAEARETLGAYVSGSG